MPEKKIRVNVSLGVNVANLFQKCVGGLVSFRTVEMGMEWDKTLKARPLVFKDWHSGAMRDNCADCENSRKMFNYKPGFKGVKKRTIIVVDS